MTRTMIFALSLFFGASLWTQSEAWAIALQGSAASIPSKCRACMSECPHDSRDIKDCDRGCPSVCSKAQAQAVQQQQKAEGRAKDCYACLAECPHRTKDFKECDRGCPDKCDKESLIGAFRKAHEEAKGCVPASGGLSDDKPAGRN